jgi:hypothetical protein
MSFQFGTLSDAEVALRRKRAALDHLLVHDLQHVEPHAQ